MMEFVDLQRQFHDVPKDAELKETEHLVSLSQFEFGPSFGWSELLKCKRVILLAEAGSGKTREMEERAKRLVQDGRLAFFVALESLHREPIADILSVEEEKRLKQWKADGKEPAWFFLDAVDELKLTSGGLDRALNRLSKDLDGLLGLARVIISCRPSDWRPIEDLKAVQNRLPVPQRSGNAPSQTSEDMFIEVLRREFGHMSPVPDEDADLTDRDTPRIVAMLPMNDTQIRLFAEQSGVNNATAFLAEIDKQNAWTFARRPLDLSDLIAAWTDSGRVGTRAQQHQANVAAKLKDGPDRPDSGVLPDAKAQFGAERLALALTLTRTRTIRSPEQVPDIRSAKGILDVADILTDWTEAEGQALLRRALFDPATYGRVRFHHRSVQEYLAARRLRALREDGMSTKALFRLLFAERYGVKVVPPSMRAITAWLALWDNAVRKELIEREPETLISFGDPGTLDLATRSDLLRAFVGRYGQGDWRGLDFTIDDVLRLSHPELALVIQECWGDEPANHDVRSLLLQLIWQGSIRDCADLADVAARKTDWDPVHRIAAIRAILACGCDDRVRELANEMLAHPESWPNEIVCGVVADLFPDIITVEKLVSLIEDRSGESDRTERAFAWAFRQIAEAILAGSEQAIDLRRQLADLIWRRRGAKQDLHDIRSRFGHFASALATLCERQLSEPSSTPSDELIRACVIASRFGGQESIRQNPVGRLRTHFDTNSNWRNDAFWAELAFMDELVPSDDDQLRLHHVEMDGLVGALVDADRPWLETALEDESRPERQVIALHALLRGWLRRGGVASELDRLRAKFKDGTSFERVLAEWTTLHERNDKLESMEQEARHAARARDDREAQRLEDWKKWRKEMLVNPADAFSAEKSKSTIRNLYRWLCAARPNQSRYGLWDKDALIQAFETEVADRAETALRALWRTTQPKLCSTRPADERGSMPYDWIFGLQGLLAEASAPGWTASLSSAEASTAAAYATIELNGFAPFISELAESHAQEVEAVIGGEVSAELRVGGSHNQLPTLQNLAYADSNLKRLVIPRLTTELESWPEPCTKDSGPNLAHHLDHALRILDSSEAEDRETIAQACARRYEADPTGPLALNWLRGLLRFDAVRGTEALIGQFADGNDPATGRRPVETLAALFGGRDPIGFQITDTGQRARLLGQLVRHAYAFIRPVDDEVHEGVYTPNARDNAERARSSLLSWLLDTPGAEANRIIMELAEEQDLVHISDRLRLLARQQAAADAELPPFDAKDVIDLEHGCEAPPKDRDGLFAVMMDRLEDIAHDLAHHDFTIRQTVRSISDEAEMQRYLAGNFETRAKGIYEVTREEEVVDRKRTDIRLLATNCVQKAVVEVKVADRWTLTQFKEALREQLVKQYLRHTNCKAGCLLLTYRGEKAYWKHPETKEQIKFPELVTILKDEAHALEAETQHHVRITVFGLDLTDPIPNNLDFEERMAQAETIIGRYRNTLHVLSK